MSVQILNSELLYDGYLKFRVDRIQMPNGFTFPLSYLDTIAAVLVLPICAAGIVMIRQYRHPVKREVLDLPGGSIDAGETFEQAARRELLEEAGYTAEEWHSLGAFHHAPGCMNSLVHVFAARGLTQGVAKPDLVELITPVIVPFADFERLIGAEPMEATAPLAYLLAQRKGLLPV
jgi:ADP-ribose pyrophosphatase